MVVIALGVAGGPGPGRRALVVDELVEDLVDQAEVPAGVGELLLDVDQVVRQAVEPRRRRAKHRERGAGALGEKPDRIVHHPDLEVASGADRRGGRPVEHGRHLAEDRPRGVDPGERHAVVLDHHRARHQHQHPLGPRSLVDQHLAGRHGLDRQVGGEVEQVGHGSSLGDPCRGAAGCPPPGRPPARSIKCAERARSDDRGMTTSSGSAPNTRPLPALSPARSPW